MPGIYNQEFVFFEKVKEKLENEDDYQAFLKCLNIYNQGIIKKNELQNLVRVRQSQIVLMVFWSRLRSLFNLFRGQACLFISLYVFTLVLKLRYYEL